jgi:hypothetical protein
MHVIDPTVHFQLMQRAWAVLPLKMLHNRSQNPKRSIVTTIPLITDSFNAREVRCYCNQPKCVPQGYMCRGKKCFTELPTPSRANTPLSQAGHSTHSGCLDESFKHRQCPAGFLCCDQDLCNHVDSPAMRNRLNKTLQGSTSALLFPVSH